MKKLLSILLAVAMSMTATTSLVFAEGEVNAQTGADYFPGWTIKDNTGGRTIERVYDDAKQSYMAKITSDGTSAQWNVLKYQVPKSFLTAGHTYTVNLDLKSEGFASDANCWVNIAMGGVNKQPNVTAITNWGTRADKGIDLNAGREISISLTHAASGSVYIDNLKITDEQTGEVLAIENGDFENVASDYVMDATADTMPGWTLSTVNTIDIDRVYNFGRGSWEARITYTGSGAWKQALVFSVSRELLTTGHTYTISADVRSEGFTTDNYFGYAWGDGYNLTVGNVTSHLTGGPTLSKTGRNLYTYPNIGFGVTGASTGILYIDNLVVTDETEGKVLNLENTDFENVAADYTQVGNSVTMPSWKVLDNANATVERVYNFTRDSWESKITYGGNGAWKLMLTYPVSRELLTQGHTYAVSAYVRSEGFTTDNYFGYAWGQSTLTPGTITNQLTSGLTISKTGKDLYSYPNIGFGVTGASTGTIYVDKLVVTDETTGEVINLENADFESVIDESVSFTSNNGGQAIAQIVSRNETYDINIAWATYSVDEDGNKTLDEMDFEKKTVVASDSVQTFPINPTFKAGCVTKAFLWDAGTLMPLADAITFDVVESAE